MARRSSRERERRFADGDNALRAVYADETATPTELIAIDPGDQHVGVAFFGRHEGQWYIQDAQQIDDTDGFEDALLETILTTTVPLTVVYERFRLYEDKAMMQKGSEFRTAQMIGVIKFIVRQRHLHWQRHRERQQDTVELLPCEQRGGMCQDLPDGPPLVILVGQMADIQKPTAGILRHKKIKSMGKRLMKENPGWGDHVVSAELHGFHYILKTLEAEIAPGF